MPKDTAPTAKRQVKVYQAGAAYRMRMLRLERGHTLARVAEALGISKQAYSDMEMGKLRIRRRDLVTLAVHYDLDIGRAFADCYLDARAA